MPTIEELLGLQPDDLPWAAKPAAARGADIQAALQGPSPFPADATELLQKASQAGYPTPFVEYAFSAYMKKTHPDFALGDKPINLGTIPTPEPPPLPEPTSEGWQKFPAPVSSVPPLENLRETGKFLSPATERTIADIVKGEAPTSAGSPEVQQQLTQALPESILPRGKGMIIPTPGTPIAAGPAEYGKPAPTIGDRLGLQPDDLPPISLGRILAPTEASAAETPPPGKNFPVVKTTMTYEDLLGLKPGDLEPEPPPSLVSGLVPTALRVGGSVAGWGAGVAATPFLGPLAAPVGGAIGAGLGELGARAYQGDLGTKDILPTALVTLAGFTQLGPLPSLIETMGREAAINLVITTASTLADRGELPSNGEVALATVLGAAGGYLGGRAAARHAPVETAPPAALPPIEPMRSPEMDLPLAQIRQFPEPRPETPTSSLLRQAQETIRPGAITEPPPSPTSTLLQQAQEAVTTGQPLFPARPMPGRTEEPPVSEMLARLQGQRRADLMDRPLPPEATAAQQGEALIRDITAGQATLQAQGEDLARLQGQRRADLMDRIIASEKPAGTLENLISQLDKERGSAAAPIVRGITGAGIGGLAGYQVGDTEEARRRNAVLGAIGGVAALPAAAYGWKALSQSLGRTAETPTTPVLDTIIRTISTKNEDIAKNLSRPRPTSGDYELAYNTAQEAGTNIRQLLARADDVTKKNRLFKVISDEFVPSGTQPRYEETITGAAQTLADLSNLAQRLTQMAAAGDTEAAKLAHALFGDKDPRTWAQFMNVWRGSLTGTPSTAGHIAVDQAAAYGTTMADRFFARSLQGAAEGRPLQGVQAGAGEVGTLLGTGARRVGELGQKIGARLGLSAPPAEDRLAAVFAAHPSIDARIANEPVEGTAVQPGTVNAILRGYGKFTQAVNKPINVQEQVYRRTAFESQLRSGLAEIGQDFETINPRAIPPRVLEKAADIALKMTSARKPTSDFGKDVARTFANTPILYFAQPFIRNTANKLVYMTEHSPIGLIRLFTQSNKRTALQNIIDENIPYRDAAVYGATAANKATFKVAQAEKAMGQIDSNPEILGKVMTGTLIPLAGAMYLRNSEHAGEHWWEVKAGAHTFDMRPFQTIAGYMFVAELGNQIARYGPDPSNWTIPKEDVVQGLAVIGTRAGIGLTLLDMYSGRGGNTLDGAKNLAADLVGMIPAAFTNPIRPLKNIAAGVQEAMGVEHPSEANQLSWQGSLLERAGGPTVANIPFVGSALLKPRPLATSALPAHMENPVAQGFGLPAQTTHNPLETKLTDLGIPPAQISPSAHDKATQRDLTTIMGPMAEKRGSALVSSASFQHAPRWQQELQLSTLMEQIRRQAEATLARTNPAAYKGLREERLPGWRKEMLKQQQ